MHIRNTKGRRITSTSTEFPKSWKNSVFSEFRLVPKKKYYRNQGKAGYFFNVMKNQIKQVDQMEVDQIIANLIALKASCSPRTWKQAVDELQSEYDETNRVAKLDLLGNSQKREFALGG